MTRNTKSEIAAVLADWGTSKVKFWAWSGGEALSEPVSDPRGMKFITPGDYPEVLEAGRRALGTRSDVPVLICGMAGARGGWHEAGYLSAPTSLGALAEEAVRVPDQAADIRILPGVSLAGDQPDVMRGEETQLAGLVGEAASTLVCLPGTHSKWAKCEGPTLEAFTTYMTGELFEIISKHSILSHTLDSDWDDESFQNGVDVALANPAGVWSNFFGLRAAAVLEQSNWPFAVSRLSGLLIGAECAAAKGAFGAGAVTLVADGRMARSYASALGAAGFDVTCVDGETVTKRGLAKAAQDLWGN